MASLAPSGEAPRGSVPIPVLSREQRIALRAALARLPLGEITAHMVDHGWRWHDGLPTSERMLQEVLALGESSVLIGGWPVDSGGFSVEVEDEFVEVPFQGKGRRLPVRQEPPTWSARVNVRAAGAQPEPVPATWLDDGGRAPGDEP